MDQVRGIWKRGKPPYRMTLQLCVDRSTSGDKYDDTAALWTEPQVFGGENIQYDTVLWTDPLTGLLEGENTGTLLLFSSSFFLGGGWGVGSRHILIA